MPLSQTVRKVPKELLYKRTIFCRENYNPWTYDDPVYRGTLLWLREQARKAEVDPSREWLGLDHEFQLLQSRTHPDPHPEHIIFGQDTENFDPAQLEYPDSEIRLADSAAFNELDCDVYEEDGFPVNSQRLLAHLCRRGMDVFLGIKEDD